MAYNTGYANIIQGLGQFAQGYAQGQRMREEDAMRKAQFEQQQQLHGLRLQEAQNKMQNEQIAQRASMLARATMTGDWQTASALHNEMTGGTVTSVSENDANSVKLTRPDGSFSVVPKLEYASIISAGNDLGLMRQSIGNIMNAESRMEQIQAKAKADAEKAAEQRQFKAGEAEKSREAQAMRDAKREALALKLAGMRLSSRVAKAAGPAAAGSTGGVKGWVHKTTKEYWMAKGKTEQEASDLATEQLIIDPRKESDELKLARSAYKDMAENGTAEQRKIGQAMLAEIAQRAMDRAKPRGPVSKTGNAPATTGGPDFGALGFKQDAKTGNWQNPNTGVFFRVNNGKPEAWSNTRKAWVPVN